LQVRLPSLQFGASLVDCAGWNAVHIDDEWENAARAGLTIVSG